MSSQITIQCETDDRLTGVKKDIAAAKKAIESLKKNLETLEGTTNSDKDDHKDELRALREIDKLRDEKKNYANSLSTE